MNLGAINPLRSLVFSQVRRCRCPVFNAAVGSGLTNNDVITRPKSTKCFYSSNPGRALDEGRPLTHFGYENVTESEKKEKGVVVVYAR